MKIFMIKTSYTICNQDLVQVTFFKIFLCFFFYLLWSSKSLADFVVKLQKQKLSGKAKIFENNVLLSVKNYRSTSLLRFQAFTYGIVKGFDVIKELFWYTVFFGKKILISSNLLLQKLFKWELLLDSKNWKGGVRSVFLLQNCLIKERVYLSKIYRLIKIKQWTVYSK